MNYNPKTEIYWDKSDLEKEMHRVIDICNGCRLCDALCPTFDVLFDKIDLIDDEINKNAEAKGENLKDPLSKLTSKDYDEIVELCYHCKLCYPKCPYVPPHQYMLDFPRLMMRWHLVSKKEKGIKFTDKLLGNPDLIGKIGSTFPDLMNWANRNSLNRKLMEVVAGIHQERNLPKYYGETFIDWFKKRQGKKVKSDKEPIAKVALFYTCSINYNNIEIGKAAVEVLEKNNIEVICPEQICCGLPNIDGGDLEAANKKINSNVENLFKAVEAGYDIIILEPSCTLFIKQEYMELAENQKAAEIVSKNSYDICEYLMKLHKAKLLNLDFKKEIGKIIYHLPCHLKAQNIGLKSRDLLLLIPNTQVEVVQQCSGHDGTWSMKKEYFEVSMKVGKKLFNRIEKAVGSTVVSDCTLSHLQIEYGTGRKVKHPILLVKEAYGI